MRIGGVDVCLSGVICAAFINRSQVARPIAARTTMPVTASFGRNVACSKIRFTCRYDRLRQRRSFHDFIKGGARDRSA